MPSTSQLVSKLMDQIQTATLLKSVSQTLEELAQDRRFKLHTNAIVTDESLTDQQKKRQLSHLIKSIELPILVDFFDNEALDASLWLFSSERIDYFDQFVREFQLTTENIEVVHLVTAIELPATDLTKITKDLSKAFGYKVILKHEVNPKIIGGVQIKIENLVYDFSLKLKFQQFQQQWVSTFEKTETKLGL